MQLVLQFIQPGVSGTLCGECTQKKVLFRGNKRIGIGESVIFLTSQLTLLMHVFENIKQFQTQKKKAFQIKRLGKLISFSPFQSLTAIWLFRGLGSKEISFPAKTCFLNLLTCMQASCVPEFGVS